MSTHLSDGRPPVCSDSVRILPQRSRRSRRSSSCEASLCRRNRLLISVWVIVPPLSVRAASTASACARGRAARRWMPRSRFGTDIARILCCASLTHRRLGGVTGVPELWCEPFRAGGEAALRPALPSRVSLPVTSGTVQPVGRRTVPTPRNLFTRQHLI